MLIDVKYKIGDKVRFKHPVVAFRRVKCACCDGIGTIIGRDGKEYECPECEGNGYLDEEYKDYDAVHESTIRGIECFCYGDKREPYVLYQMSDWKWSQTQIAENQILGVIE